jgi:hypothetical protein
MEKANISEVDRIRGRYMHIRGPILSGTTVAKSENPVEKSLEMAT